MNTSITKVPQRTAFVVKNKQGEIVPLVFWCKDRGVKYNTIQARVWRAGLSGNEMGLVVLDPEGEHKKLLKTKVRPYDIGEKD